MSDCVTDTSSNRRQWTVKVVNAMKWITRAQLNANKANNSKRFWPFEKVRVVNKLMHDVDLTATLTAKPSMCTRYKYAFIRHLGAWFDRKIENRRDLNLSGLIPTILLADVHHRIRKRKSNKWPPSTSQLQTGIACKSQTIRKEYIWG